MNAPIWEEGFWPPLAPLAETVRSDVCVVGLGGSGLAAIDELLAAGARVVGIDAAGVGSGAAGRNAGFLLAGLADFYHRLVQKFGDAVATRLYRETLAEIDRMRRDFPGEISIPGVLRLAADEAEWRDCEAQYAALRRHGFGAERHDGPDGRGVLTPTDGVFQPLRFARHHARVLIAAGARLCESSPVSRIETGRVMAAAGEVTCDAVIVAVDGRLEQLLPELRPRVRTARLQMLATAPTREVAFPRPVYWRHGFEYWQQVPGGGVVLGGFRDAGGDAEWTFETTPSTLIQERLEEFLRHHLHVTAPITHRWAASVSYTPDRLPILEEIRPRIYAAGAYSGTGNVVGRVNGRAAARLALGRNSAWQTLLQTARGADR